MQTVGGKSKMAGAGPDGNPITLFRHENMWPCVHVPKFISAIIIMKESMEKGIYLQGDNPSLPLWLLSLGLQEG